MSFMKLSVKKNIDMIFSQLIYHSTNSITYLVCIYFSLTCHSSKYSMKVQNIISAFVLFLVLNMTNCQVGRDIVIQFLGLDKDNNYILSPDEISHIQLPTQLANKHYNLPLFKRQLYPKTFYKEFDQDKDNKISYVQLSQILQKKWALYGNLWGPQTTNLLSFIDQNQYFKVCDTNNDNKLEEQQFPACMHAVLTLDSQDFPWKIKSIYYKNKNMGYSYEEYKKLIPKFGEQKILEQYAKKFFHILEWDKNLIPSDVDDLIGPEQGKIMQAIIIFTYLDNNIDGQLSKQQALFFFKNFGGELAFSILDANKNNIVDKLQFIAYLNYALCIDCGKQTVVENKMEEQQIKPKTEQKNEEIEIINDKKSQDEVQAQVEVEVEEL